MESPVLGIVREFTRIGYVDLVLGLNSHLRQGSLEEGSPFNFPVPLLLQLASMACQNFTINMSCFFGIQGMFFAPFLLLPLSALLRRFNVCALQTFIRQMTSFCENAWSCFDMILGYKPQFQQGYTSQFRDLLLGVLFSFL